MPVSAASIRGLIGVSNSEATAHCKALLCCDGRFWFNLVSTNLCVGMTVCV